MRKKHAPDSLRADEQNSYRTLLIRHLRRMSVPNLYAHSKMITSRG